jgi:hypothetical protein
MKKAVFAVLFAGAILGLLLTGGCGKGKKRKKRKPKAVKWVKFSSSSLGVKFLRPEGFTADPSAKGTFTDGVGGFISASFDKDDKTKGGKSLDAIIASEITRRKKDTLSNFKKLKVKEWKKGFEVLKQEKLKMGSHDAVEVELSLATQAKDGAQRKHVLKMWIRVDGGLITMKWYCSDEADWEKYYKRYFKKSRESLKVTK